MAGSSEAGIRWIFSEITPESFLCIAEALEPDAKSWKIEGKFRARRVR